MAEVLIVTTTVGSEAVAMQLAEQLIAEKVAACVQLEPVRSFYRWNGEMCRDAEWRLVIKTSLQRQNALDAFLAQAHPYELPEYTAAPHAASAAYAAWVDAQCSV